MASSASQRFAATPELLYVLASQVCHPRTPLYCCDYLSKVQILKGRTNPVIQVAYQRSLFNLSLVNKTFHAIFTPKLYSELWLLQEELIDEAETRRLLENPNLRHVRILDVDATLETSSPRGSFDGDFDLAVLSPDGEDLFERMTHGIRVLLAETHALQNFRQATFY